MLLVHFVAGRGTYTHTHSLSRVAISSDSAGTVTHFATPVVSKAPARIVKVRRILNDLSSFSCRERTCDMKDYEPELPQRCRAACLSSYLRDGGVSVAVGMKLWLMK